MFFIKIVNGLPVQISNSSKDCYEMIDGSERFNSAWQNRWDWMSLEEVQRLAMYITAMIGEVYIGTDAGSCVSPRFDIQRMPKVGDEVSYSFNGDTYHCGTIVRITKNQMVLTSEGKKFNRRGLSGSWKMIGSGGWNLISGHHYEQNPHF